MSWRRITGLMVGLLAMLLIPMAPLQAGMVGTHELLREGERAQLIDRLQREDVQQELVRLGVDPAAAHKRVDQMTDEEVAQLTGQITELPAGGSLSAIQLLLIIVIIILLV